MEKIPTEIMQVMDELKKYIVDHEAFIRHVETQIAWRKNALKKLEEKYG